MATPKRSFRIWLNKNGPGTMRLLEEFRYGDEAGKFTLVCSHPDSRNAVATIADTFIQEPDNLEEQAYVDWCLNFALRSRIDLFIPGHHLPALTQAREAFEKAGVHLLIPADSSTLAMIADKAKLYEHLRDTAPEMVSLPAHAVSSEANHLEREAKLLNFYGHQVCFKPAIASHGRGFHILTEDGNALDRFLSGDRTRLSMEEALFYLRQRRSFPPLLVMQFLPGAEHSADCLAVNGDLKACVSRLKSADKDCQLLEDNPLIFNQAKALTKHLGLNGLYNLQFKDDAQGKAKFLDLNPGLSEGLAMSCLSGFNFLYWAAKLALEPESIRVLPVPRRGLKVRDLSQPELIL